MKGRGNGVMVGLILLACLSVRAQEAEEIISKSIEALGSKAALNKIKSLKMKGTLGYPSSDVKYNLTIYRMHPDLYRSEKEYSGKTIVEAYDGKHVWHIVPFDGIDSPTIVKDEVEISKMKSESDILTPLLGWKEKECQVEYLGKKVEGNVELHHLKMTFNDGYVTDFYLNANNYLLQKFVRKERHNPRGRTNEVTTHVSDYRKVANVMFAHRFEMDKGFNSSIIIIEQIEVNPKDFDNSIFLMDSK
jgi:hypothetical protein